jgi:hypothetical protein
VTFLASPFHLSQTPSRPEVDQQTLASPLCRSAAAILVLCMAFLIRPTIVRFC